MHEETAGICIFVVRIEKLTTMKTCGLDVHKDMIFCAIYDGKDAVVEKFNTFTPDLRAMCAYISGHGVDTVAMESTGVYIDAIRTVLRQSGMKAVVVNPFLIKQMPGRKSDTKDAVWIAKLMHKGMLPSSFIPDGLLSELRAYTREYTRLVQRRSAILTKVDRFMVSGGIRLSSCLSKITTQSYRKVAFAVADGEGDPETLAALVRGCTRHKRDGSLVKALTGCMEEFTRWRMRIALEELELCEKQIEESKKVMTELADANYREQVSLLCTVPGISLVSAICILAEIGADMTQFGSSGRLAGWAGLRPRNDESAGKYKSTAVTKGGSHLKPMLVQCAWGAVHTGESAFQAFFRRLSSRKSAKKAIIAVARKLLTAVYAILLHHEEYSPKKTSSVSPEQLHRMVQYHARQYQRLTAQLPPQTQTVTA